MKKISLTILIILCSISFIYAQEKVLVSAAANISAVEKPLKEAFAKKYPAYALEFTFGASGNLVTQISNGAPAQVFLSADKGFAQKLVDGKLAAGPVKVYTVGKLIFLATKPVDLSKGLEVLLDPAVVQYANCNPDIAPYGKAATEALTKTGLLDKVKSKQVTAQTITQAVQFTLTSTGFGFVNKSSLFSKEVQPYNQEGKFWFEVDPKLYAPIEQGFVVLKSAEDKAGAKAFAEFLMTKDAQSVFAAYGYGAP